MNENENKLLDGSSVKDYFTRIGIACLLLRVITTGLQYILAAVLAGTAFYDHWSFNFFLSIVPLYCVAIPVFWLVLPKKLAPVGEKRRFGIGRFLMVCPMCIAAMMIFNYVGFYLTQLINLISGGTLGNTDGLTSLVNSSPIWATVLFVCIAAPIMEEIVFRKLLIDRILPFGELQACLFSGLIFGLFHGNFRQFFYATALGFIFAYVYVKTRNILYTIALHTGINVLGSVVTPNILSQKNLDIISGLEEKLTNDPSAVTQNELFVLLAVLAVLLIGGALVITGVVLFFVRFRKIKFEKPMYEVNGGVARFIYTDPAMLAAMVFMAGMFIVALL